MITTQAELEAKLSELAPTLSEKFHVSRFGYFGSFARNEQTETSDIDILIDEDTDQHWDIKEYLEACIARKVDVVPRDMLRAEIAPWVLEDTRFCIDGRWISGFELSGSQRRVKRMKKHELYLLDMLASMKTIAQYVEKHDFESFRKDQIRVDAVQRHLIIIGEAANKVPKTIQADYPKIPWTELVKWRNGLVHEYFGFDATKTWNTVTESILPNIAEMQRLRDEECDI